MKEWESEKQGKEKEEKREVDRARLDSAYDKGVSAGKLHFTV